MNLHDKYIPNSIIRQIGFITILLILTGVLCYYMSGFLSGILGGVCLFVLLQYPLRYLHIKLKMNKLLAIILLMTVTFIIIFYPIYMLVNLLTKKVKNFNIDQDKIESTIKAIGLKLEDSFGFNLFDSQFVSKATSYAAQFIQTILNTTLDSIVQLAIAFFILFFMLSSYKQLDHWLNNNIPLKKENLRVLNKEMHAMIISNTIGVPLVSLGQAIIAYIGYLIFDLPDPFTWFVLTFFAGMIPVIGTALVYLPACIVLYLQGDQQSSFLLLAYCLILVGSVDNIFRFLIQKKLANVHPLITVFGVIVGVNIFGFIGIIFGPILFSLLIWLYNLYKLEFNNHNQSPDNPDNSYT